MIRIVRYKSTFINVPKTGSTSIRNFLFNNVFSAEDICSFHTLNGKQVSCNIQDIHKNSSHHDVKYCIENAISPKSDTFYLTIRDPLERQLSRYFYRFTQGFFSENTPKNFQDIIKKNDGMLPDKTSYHEKMQYKFGHYPDANIIWIPYPKLKEIYQNIIENWGIKINKQIIDANVSLPNQPRTKYLIDLFYDKQSRLLAEKCLEKDIELYEKISKENYFFT